MQLARSFLVSSLILSSTPLLADEIRGRVESGEVYEEIVVTAGRGGDGFAPVSIASTMVRTEDKVAAATTLTELVEGVPGVAENGQGGLFQVFSIRGVSRQRVMTLVSGMRITGERRAGVATSFVDPFLMDSADVLRGPSSTYYGSGALGGVVQVFPRHFESSRFSAGSGSSGDESHLAFGGDLAGWSFALAGRRRDNTTAADGTELNDHFTQYSASLARQWRRDGLSWNLLALPSLGRDIGKSSTDFPARTTNYPRESHLLLRLGVTSDRGWSVHAFAHPNDLRTETLRVGKSFTTVDNEALDFGSDFQRELTLGTNVSGRYGFDYFGRRGVEARERGEDFASGAVSAARTLDGEEDELASFGSLRWSWGPAKLQAGVRFTWHRQGNRGAAQRQDTAWTGFLGLVRPLGGGVELAVNVGTGLRFASLSERFFTGTTGRGQVIGNPGLEPESSLSTDLGLRWYGNKAFLSGQVFHLAIDDYIERVDAGDLRTFVNLTSGSLVGFELDGFCQPHERWLLTWSGHLIDGEEDGTGRPLADVPADRFQVGLSYRQGRWESRGHLQYRLPKDDPASGEKAIPRARLLSLSLAYEIREGLTLTASAENLFDEIYFNSADSKSPVAVGRSVGLGLLWEL